MILVQYYFPHELVVLCLCGIKTYPEALLSVSSEIPLRDSGGGDITVRRSKICTQLGIKVYCVRF